MKTQQMTKYIISTGLRWIAIYYAIMVVVLLFVSTLVRVAAESGAVRVGNSSMIFLFVAGIIFVYMFLKIGFACSASRQTVFLSLLGGGLVLALVTTAGDVLLNGLLRILLGFSALSAVPALTVNGMLSSFLLAVVWLVSGYFIGALYYRMSKAMTIIVSVGVPLLLFIILPMLVGLLPENLQSRVLDWGGHLFLYFVTSLVSSPAGFLFIAVLAVVLLGLFMWLLIRRSPIKEK